MTDVPVTGTQLILALIALILGGGGLGGLVTVLMKRKREPLEQDQISANTDHLAIQSLNISHAALHADVKWLDARLDSTRTELSTTRTELHTTRSELHTTRAELHRLRDAWGKWWEDLHHRWHEYRLQDRPPARPDIPIDRERP